MTHASFATLAVLLNGPLAGMFIASSMVEHAARDFEAGTWITYKHAKERVFGPVMPLVFNGVLGATVISAIFAPVHVPIVLAAILLGIVALVTIRIHLPLNAMIQTWSPVSYPLDWEHARRRWLALNMVRTTLSCAAFVLVLAVSL